RGAHPGPAVPADPDGHDEASSVQPPAALVLLLDMQPPAHNQLIELSVLQHRRLAARQDRPGHPGRRPDRVTDVVERAVLELALQPAVDQEAPPASGAA